MKIVNKFWWLVILFIGLTLCVLFTLALLMWEQIGADQQQLIAVLFRNQFSFVFGAVCVALGAIGFAIDGIYRNYILPISRLTEETRLIHSVNPSHRIRVEGSRDVLALAQAINEGADQFQALYHSVEQKVEQARSELEEEKNILAAIVAELPEGVMICNMGGKILLYNRRARHLLAESSETEIFVGLGRSVFRIIDKGLLEHALSHIAYGVAQGEADVVANFVMAGKDDRHLRVETVPILEADRHQSGFVLIVYDITRQLECDWRLDAMIKSLSTHMRSSLANLRAAIETLTDYPQMSDAQNDRFVRIVHQESLNLTGILEREVAHAMVCQSSAGWPMATMDAGDFFNTLKRSMTAMGAPMALTLTPPPVGTWIRVDSIAMVFALQFLMARIRSETGVDRFHLVCSSEAKILRIHLSWDGKALDRSTLYQWQNQPMESVGNRPMPMTLADVLEQHGAEIWGTAESQEAVQRQICIFIPRVEKAETKEGRGMTFIPRSRPEFYDFDLFNQPGQLPELDNRPLSDLTYTVFDTETTGLNPKGGDEIISIGAVRILNGQLLKEEIFHQLVDPQRDLPWESIKIHGIRPEMLQGKPFIDSVLARFSRFVSDTILVGHNAAFDMRMLQVKEAVSGVRFINPVLDTMLLSAVVHPAQTDHSMEGLAQRLGIEIRDRHSALGDALTTGELFLRLIPLLAKLDIFTLRQARVASQKTYYARLKF